MAEIILVTKNELETIIQNSIQKSFHNHEWKNKLEIPEFLSIDEASSYLSLAKQTLYGFTSKRTIPFIKRGKRLYFKKSDLANWLNEGRKLSSIEITNFLK